ncbi:MAG TPA: hypothetical protein DEF68_09520 [Elusimicrobia bacterium]|nr:hypothetical protein [Elusimicrobiota bacterium]
MVVESSSDTIELSVLISLPTRTASFSSSNSTFFSAELADASTIILAVKSHGLGKIPCGAGQFSIVTRDAAVEIDTSI